MDDEYSVVGYKAFLRDCLNRRPSGLRQKLAAALGKHKSFISQITSPSYSVPIPAGDLPTIFEVCHLSSHEQEQFLALYEHSHPGRSARASRVLKPAREVRITVPAFRSETTAREVEAAIHDTAARIVRLAQAAERGLGNAGKAESDEEIPE